MDASSTTNTKHVDPKTSVGSFSSLESHHPSWSLRPRNIVVFSGGSAANNLVDLFKKITEDKKCQLSYVIPISDNGGSSSELIRVFGGPGMSRAILKLNVCLIFLTGIGDLRSVYIYDSTRNLCNI